MRQAEAIVSVIEGALGELGIDQDARVRSVISEQLRRAAQTA